MKILLPFPEDFKKCAKFFDDSTLKHQISELHNLQLFALEDRYCSSIKNNPYVVHYTKCLASIALYEVILCKEYQIRFKVPHPKLNSAKENYALLRHSPTYDQRFEPLFVEGRKPRTRRSTDFHDVRCQWQNRIIVEAVCKAGKDKDVVWTRRYVPHELMHYVYNSFFNDVRISQIMSHLIGR